MPDTPVERPRIDEGEEAVAAYLEDAAHSPGGHSPCIARPTTEGEIAWLVRNAPSLLPIGAQSSLTGGATPHGDWLLSTAAMDFIGPIEGARIRVGPGVPLLVLIEKLSSLGWFYPPTPTFTGAFIGGTIATNAAGAATFKYGATRRWIEGLSVVLSDGDVLDLERGAVHPDEEGCFEILSTYGQTRRIKAPRYPRPNVPKLSAGYHSDPDLDLIDLFIGSEGTLGVVTSATLKLLERTPSLFVGFLTLSSIESALSLVMDLTDQSRQTWKTADPSGLDVAAVEMIDRRSMDLIAEDGAHRDNGVDLPADHAVGLLFQVELPSGLDAEEAMDQIACHDEPDAPDTPLVRLCRTVEKYGDMEHLQPALPGDRRREEQLFAIREAVPMAINHRVGDAKRHEGGDIHKVAADVIVPLPRFLELLEACEATLGRRGLDYAVFGHISDGNVHPNLIPRCEADVRQAEEALLELGERVKAMGGAPISEHGVGRSPMRQALLRQLHGDEGLKQMRAVKEALDPEWKLAPGVLFPR